MNYLRLHLAWVIFFMIVLTSLHSQSNEKTIIIKRRVAIIPIYNSTKLADNDFLSSGIADSLRAALSSTDSFIVYDQNIIENKLIEGGINLKQFIWEDTAIKASEILDADVIVFGFFQLISPKVINIHLNALDAEVRKSATTIEVEGPTGVQITTVFNDIAAQMAGKMKDALPPYTKTVKEFNKAAIIDIKGSGVSLSDLSRISESIRTSVIQLKKFDVVEETLVDSVLKELKLDGKSAFTSEDLIKIASALGVQMLITGNITGGLKYSINIEARDGENGAPLFSKKYQFAKTGKEFDAGIYEIGENISNYEAITVKTYDLPKKDSKSQTPGISGLKIGGIALTSAGVGFLLSGVPIILIDMLHFIPTIEKALIPMGELSDEAYNRYYDLMFGHLSLFITSIATLSLGALCIVIGIILLAVNPKKISFEPKISKDSLSYGLIYRL